MTDPAISIFVFAYSLSRQDGQNLWRIIRNNHKSSAIGCGRERHRIVEKYSTTTIPSYALPPRKSAGFSRCAGFSDRFVFNRVEIDGLVDARGRKEKFFPP